MSENADKLLTRGLIIDEPWISLILSGKKTWEMRSTGTRKREPIGLIRKGTGQVVGIADLVDSLPALSREDYARNEAFHRIPLECQPAAILGRRVRPWVLRRSTLATNTNSLSTWIGASHLGSARCGSRCCHSRKLIIGSASSTNPRTTPLDSRTRFPGSTRGIR